MNSVQSGKWSLRMPDNDCRRYRRFTVDLTGRVIKIPDPNMQDSEINDYLNLAIDVDVLNLSASGLFYESPFQLMKGQQVWVILNLPKTNAVVRAVIRHTVIRRENRTLFYGSGIQYIRSPLADSGITAIIEHLSDIVNSFT